MSDKPLCGTCHPPEDDTRDREIVDRFADFLRVAGRPATRADVAAGRGRLRSPSERYHLGLMAWKVGWFPEGDG